MRLLVDAIRPYAELRHYDPIDLEHFTNRYAERARYIELFGFYLISRETFDALVARLRRRRVLEVFAGSGYLAHRLALAGIDVTACDNAATGYAGMSGGWRYPYKRDLTADATTLDLTPYDVVLMCWPDYKIDAAERVARKLAPGQTLIYQGESAHGCTGTPELFELLEAKFEELPSDDLNEHHPRFSFIHDSWRVYRRKEAA